MGRRKVRDAKRMEWKREDARQSDRETNRSNGTVTETEGYRTEIGVCGY